MFSSQLHINIWQYLKTGFFFLLLHCFTSVSSLPAQVDSAGLVRYTPEFRFEDGIYLTFEQLKNNNPIPKSRLITDVDYSDRDFFETVMESRNIYFYDQFGMRQQIKTADIWGFSRNGVPFIAMDDGYYRITVVGSICHFVATVTTYDTRYHDPYYYNPYYYNSYNRYGGYYPSTYSSSEMRQYILDFETGNLMEYEVSSLEVMLMRDPELHYEYSQLRRKKKRQLKFLYLRKFNERNPIFIPVQSD
jgi:hypothetical protein